MTTPNYNINDTLICINSVFDAGSNSNIFTNGKEYKIIENRYSTLSSLGSDWNISYKINTNDGFSYVNEKFLGLHFKKDDKNTAYSRAMGII